jgi:MinD superfamily P-loop ATPase
MEESLLKRLIASIKCGACGQHYEESDIDVMEHNGELWFLRVFCSSCHTRCLVAAIIREEEKAGVITDLTGAELDKFKDVDSAGVDDMLDMHVFLKDFNGDFSRLFQRE